MARLILLALALRLALPVAAWWASRDARVFLTGDSPQYLTAAVSLWNEGRYDGPPPRSSAEGALVVRRLAELRRLAGF